MAADALASASDVAVAVSVAQAYCSPVAVHGGRRSRAVARRHRHERGSTRRTCSSSAPRAARSRWAPPAGTGGDWRAWSILPARSHDQAAPAELWPDVRPERPAAHAVGLTFVRRARFPRHHTRDIATGAGMSRGRCTCTSAKVGLLFAISHSGHEQTLAMVTAAIAKGTDLSRPDAVPWSPSSCHGTPNGTRSPGWSNTSWTRCRPRTSQWSRICDGRTEQLVRDVMRDRRGGRCLDVPDQLLGSAVADPRPLRVLGRQRVSSYWTTLATVCHSACHDTNSADQVPHPGRLGRCPSRFAAGHRQGLLVSLC